MLLSLPTELLTAIAGMNGAACQRLWKYLPIASHSEIAVTADFIRDLRMLGIHFRGDTPYEKTTLFGLLHSFDDLPALQKCDVREWFRAGQLHRYNAPAIILAGAAVSHAQYQPRHKYTTHDISNKFTTRIWVDRGKVWLVEVYHAGKFFKNYTFDQGCTYHRVYDSRHYTIMSDFYHRGKLNVPALS